MAVKLLLYEKRTTAGNPNQILLKNHTFDTSMTGWGSFSSDWAWDGAGGMECIGTGPSSVFALFASDMLTNTFYNVTFDVSGSNGEAFSLFLGLNFVASITANGSYSFSFHSPINQANLPIAIGFYTTSSTLQCVIDNVYITQDPILSPVDDTVEYYVERSYIDMFPDVNMGLNFQVADIKKISGKLGSFSKRFEVPGSQNNKEAFSHLYANNAQPYLFDPRNKTKCKLIDESEGCVILDGWLNLSNISYTRDEVRFEVELYDNSFGLLDGIRGKKMKDLDLSSFNHSLTVQDVVETFSTGWTWHRAYCYPFLYKEIPIYSIGEDFYPFFFDRKLFDSVIQDYAGFGYTLSPLAETVMENKITSPYGTMPKINKDYAQSLGIDVTGSGDVYNANGTTSYFAGVDSVNAISPDLPLPNETSDPSNMWGFNGTRWVFSAETTGDYDVSFSIPISVALESLQLPGNASLGSSYTSSPFANGYGSFESNLPLSIKAQLVSLTYGIVVGESQTYERTTPSTFNATGMTFTSENVTLNYGGVNLLQADEQLYMRLVVSNGLNFQYFAPYPIVRRSKPKDTVTIQSGGFLRISYGLTNDISEGAQISLNDFLPAISMEQFISDQVTEMNMFIIPNGPKRIDFITRSEFYDPSKPYVDWSGLLDKDSKVLIQYLTEISSSEVEFGYKESDEEYNTKYRAITKGPQYGDYSFNYETDFFNDVEEIRLKTYEPTPIIANIYNDLLPAILTTELPSAARNLLWGDRLYPNIAAFKLLWHDAVGEQNTGVTSRRTALHIDDIDSSELDINFGSVDFVLSNANINLTSNNLYNLFYADQTKLFKKTRLYTCWMKLNNEKVSEITKDLGKRIWCQELNNYFLLNSIIDFDPINNGLTKVELLEWVPTSGELTYQTVSQSTTIHPAPITIKGERRQVDTGINNRRPYVGGWAKSGIIIGNENRIASEGYVINGSGNTVDAGSNDVLLFGTDNLHVTGGTYADFFQSRVTLDKLNANFYSAVTAGISGLTVFGNYWNQTGITIGDAVINQTGFTISSGVTLTSTGLTIGSLVITSSGITTTGSTLPAASDGEMMYNSGGTWTKRDMGIRVSDGGPNVWMKLGHSTNTIDTGSTLAAAGILLGTGNYLSGNGVIIGGKSNIFTGQTPGLTSHSGMFAGSNNYLYNNQASVMMGGAFNVMSGISLIQRSSNSIIGGTLNLLDETVSSSIIGGSGNTLNGTRGSAIIAASGITGTDHYTLYTNNIKANIVSASTLYVGGSLVSSASTLPAGTDGEMLYNSGGTWVNRDLNIRAGDSIGNWITVGASSSSVTNGSTYSGIFGGLGNNLLDNGLACTLIGGAINTFSGLCYTSSILGGVQNVINSTRDTTILGGNNNLVTSTIKSGILGGQYNVIDSCVSSSVMAGSGNTVSASESTSIISGEENRIDNTFHSTILSSYKSDILNESSSLSMGANVIGSVLSNIRSSTQSFVNDDWAGTGILFSNSSYLSGQTHGSSVLSSIGSAVNNTGEGINGASPFYSSVFASRDSKTYNYGGFIVAGTSEGLLISTSRLSNIVNSRYSNISSSVESEIGWDRMQYGDVAVVDAGSSLPLNGLNQIQSSCQSSIRSGVNGAWSVLASSIISSSASTISGQSYGVSIISSTGINSTGNTCSAVIACSGVTATEDFTLYTNNVDIQNIIDLKPISVLPAAKEGRMYYSGGTGLMICTGTTSSDWKRVQLI